MRWGWTVTGLALAVAAVLAADLARAHMALAQALCGAGPVPHCGWCLGAAGLTIAGLAAFRQAALAPHGGGLLQTKA